MRQEAELLRPASQTLEARPEVPGRFRIIRQFCTFENEASNWALLNEPETSPAHHYAWLRACAEVLSPGYELRCVTVGGFDPEAIALLTERKRFPGRLECLGAE